MRNKLIIRLSNEIGNQMFMYASAYSISKKLNRELLIDNETAFLSKKNISKFGLNNFNISSNICSNEYKFKNLKGYLKRKISKKIDFLRYKKKFYIEKKDKMKITYYSDEFLNKHLSNIAFMEGHFESYKYFDDLRSQILDEFSFKNLNILKKNDFYNELNSCNSVSICLRQNRFSEGKTKDIDKKNKKSIDFTLEQIRYINKSASFIKTKINNPIFYLWSNDFSSVPENLFEFNFKKIDLSSQKLDYDQRICSLFLLTQCKHFIVTTSTFNWWGAWLSNSKDKIIIRPNDTFFSNFRVNNRDFWPEEWIKLDF